MKLFQLQLQCIAGYSKNTQLQKPELSTCSLTGRNLDKEMGYGYSCIFNWVEMCYTYVSCSIKKILGFEKELFLNHGFDFSLSIIHPEDFEKLKSIYQAIFNYYYRTPAEERSRLRFSYNFRVKTVDESYINLLRQSTFIDFTDDGKPTLEQINSIDITGFNYTNDITLVVHRLSPEGTYVLCYEFTFSNEQAVLSERERQVMELIGKGYTTKEIALKLYLSMETIKSHRKKIITKTGASNMISAIHAIR